MLAHPSNLGFWDAHAESSHPMSRQGHRPLFAALAVVACTGVGLVATSGTSLAAEAPIELGTTASYAVLAGSTVTNTDPSVINGDVGLSPGPAITGFPPGTINGVTHISDAEAIQAKTDLVAAYDDAAGRTPATAVDVELGGTTLQPGVYVGPTLEITGTLTLDGGGAADSVFVLKSNDTLITAGASEVSLINGAQACNVFWKVSESATLGASSDFIGTVLAGKSVTVGNDVDIQGRLLAQTAAVTLINDRITVPECDEDLPATTTTATPTTATPTTVTPTTAPATTSTLPVTTTTAEPGTTTTLPVTTTTAAPATTTTLPATTTTPATTAPATTLPATTVPVTTIPGTTVPAPVTTVPVETIPGTTEPIVTSTTSSLPATPTTAVLQVTTTAPASSSTQPDGTTSTTADGSTSAEGDNSTTTVPSAGPGTPGITTTTLPRTGSDSNRLAGIGLIVLAIGSALVLGSRGRTLAARG